MKSGGLAYDGGANGPAGDHEIRIVVVHDALIADDLGKFFCSNRGGYTGKFDDAYLIQCPDMEGGHEPGADVT